MPLDMPHHAYELAPALGDAAADGTSWVAATCPHDCPSTCALEVSRLSDARIGKVRGAHANDYTAGVICAKVANYAARIHHPDRLTTPLLRVGDKGVGRGAYREIGWEEALDRTAEAFLAAEAKYGAEAVWPYYYAGTMGLVQRDGINRLRHAKKYSGMHATFCTTLVEAGWRAGAGPRTGVDAREIAKSDLIVVWGGNPVSTQVNVMTWIAKARKERGAKLVVIDPYATPTAAQADLHLAPRPSTDGALAAAIIHVLLRDGLADEEYLDAYTDFDADCRAHFAACPPSWAEGVTGVPAAEIEGFARLYGKTKRSYLRVGYGFSRCRNGAAAVHAVSCLPAVTGAWKYEGGGALQGQPALYPLDRTLIEGLDARDPSVRVIDQCQIGRALTGDRAALRDGPPVTAMLVQNTNPAVVAPESLKVREGMLRDDLFLCVHEQFMTDTAAFADVVLPATMFLEHDDCYTASGHTMFQVSRAVIRPPGECRANHWVIGELARRVGAEHRGFAMSEWRIMTESFAASDMPAPGDIHAARGWDASASFEDMHNLSGFDTADGLFHFKPDWAALGPRGGEMPAIAGHFDVYNKATPAHPFRLVAAPARTFLNSTFTETPASRKREGRPTARLHPAAAARLGIGDGDLVVLSNDLGEVRVHAKLTEGQREETVVVESIWPHGDFVGGVGINALISAEPGYPNGGGAFHDTAVAVRKA